MGGTAKIFKKCAPNGKIVAINSIWTDPPGSLVSLGEGGQSAPPPYFFSSINLRYDIIFLKPSSMKFRV